VIVTCPRSQAQANDALFPVKSAAYAAILPSCLPIVPNEGGKLRKLNTMFDSYKASDSGAGQCWPVKHMACPVMTLGCRWRFKPIWLCPGRLLQSVKLAKLVILLRGSPMRSIHAFAHFVWGHSNQTLVLADIQGKF
jgi:hypothetical protein